MRAGFVPVGPGVGVRLGVAGNKTPLVARIILSLKTLRKKQKEYFHDNAGRWRQGSPASGSFILCGLADGCSGLLLIHECDQMKNEEPFAASTPKVTF